MSPQSFREVLKAAIGGEGRHKAAAIEAFPEKRVETAKSELTHYLAGDRGQVVFAVIEATFKFGDRAVLLGWLQSRLRPPDPGQMLSEIGEQLSLLTYRLEEAVRVQREQAEVIPLQGYRKRFS